MAGGFLTTAAAVPQVVKAFRTRQVRDISVWQPVLLVFGMVFWLAYGLLQSDLPLILANSFSIACNLALIAMKFLYRGAPAQQ
ncbi:MAG TPA: SemiSWEET transporter [Verrucomicrobiae bacterium]|nr:SemiSWEET transporter [Verrucomicrobiae bacterium]